MLGFGTQSLELGFRGPGYRTIRLLDGEPASRCCLQCRHAPLGSRTDGGPLRFSLTLLLRLLTGLLALFTALLVEAFHAVAGKVGPPGTGLRRHLL